MLRGHPARSTTLGALLLAALVWASPGCSSSPGTSTAGDDRLPATDELALHHGHPCPARIPLDSGQDADVGPDAPAQSTPALPAVAAARVCRYDPVDAGPRYADGGGTTFSWDRAGPARRLDPDTTARVRTAVGAVDLPEEDQVCSFELGPRWMVVLAMDAGDLTGAVVDDVGCRDVLMTDEPFTTPPGAAQQVGSVPGRLTGGRDLLDLLR